MMQAVDLGRVIAQDFCQKGISFIIYSMSQMVAGPVMVAVADIARELTGQVFIHVAQDGPLTDRGRYDLDVH
jgi:hypothetical protein